MSNVDKVVKDIALKKRPKFPSDGREILKRCALAKKVLKVRAIICLYDLADYRLV